MSGHLKPLSSRQIRRGLNQSIFAGSIGMASVAITAGMPLVMFLEALGAGGVILGLMGMVQFLAPTAMIPGSFLAERYESRKKFWFPISLSGKLVWLLPVGLILTIPESSTLIAWVTLGVILSHGLIVHTAWAAWLSWISELIPAGSSGRHWGLRHSICMTAFLISILTAGWFLDYAGAGVGQLQTFAWLFLIAVLLGVFENLGHLPVPEPKFSVGSIDVPWRQRLLHPLREANFRWLTLAMGFWMFGIGITGAFGQVYLKRSFGVTYSQLAGLTVLFCLGAAMASVLWGYVIDRVGARVFGIVMLMVAPLPLALWFFVNGQQSVIISLWFIIWSVPQPVFLVGVTSLFAGVFFSGITLTQTTLSTTFSPRDNHVMGIAVHWFIVAALGAMGPIVGGVLMELFNQWSPGWMLPTGEMFSYFHLLVLLQMGLTWTVVLPLFCQVKSQENELSISEAASRFLFLNPVRAISSISNIHTLGAAATRFDHARAVRELGQHKSAIAVMDLVGRIDDPDSTVSEEAVWALAHIGSQDAVKALIEKLQDPEADLGPQIARALRICQHPMSVEPLCQMLFCHDRETVCESAKTLGAIGSKIAIGPMLGLLQSREDNKIICATGEALAQLKAEAALGPLLDYLRNKSSLVTKRSLAVAAGELFGGRDDFYRILAREEKAPGSGTEVLLKKLRIRLTRKGSKRTPNDTSHSLDSVARFATYYDQEDFVFCSVLLFQLGVILAGARTGQHYEFDFEQWNEQVMLHNPWLGMLLFFLNQLKQATSTANGGSPQRVEVLLGLFGLIRATDHEAGRVKNGASGAA